MFNAIVVIVMRWLHVAAAGTLVGMLVFILLCAGPARAWMENELDAARVKRIERRLRGVMALAIAALVVAGLYNWGASAEMYAKGGVAVHAVLGVKVVLACVLIAVLWAQDVGLMGSAGARGWRMTCLGLALLVVLLGAVVRYLRLAALGY